MDRLSGFARLALQLVLLVAILQSCSSSKVCKRQRLKFCAFSGVRKTPIKNLVDQSSQKQVRRDKRYKDFEALSATGCSNLVRPFACSIYAPVCLETFGSLPPCKSLCQKVRNSCKRYIAMNKKRKSRDALDCSYFPNPSQKDGCVDWEMTDNGLVMTVKGTPTVEQWENRRLPKFYQQTS